MKRIIISQPWGGLGDNLQYSTLPELFNKNGYDVYISVNNKTRDSEIFDLVWGKNPYIKGMVQGQPNAGECRNMYWPPDSHNEYFIHRIEISHGFEKINFFPKIYYDCQYIQELSNVIIIDLTGTSQIYELNKYIEFINYFTPIIDNINNNIKIITRNNTILPVLSEAYQYLKIKIPRIEYLNRSSLLHYCDIIKSCDTIITINSGIHSLASAIKGENSKPDIICYNPWTNFTEQQIKGYYNYKNVNYFQSIIY